MILGAGVLRLEVGATEYFKHRYGTQEWMVFDFTNIPIEGLFSGDDSRCWRVTIRGRRNRIF